MKNLILSFALATLSAGFVSAQGVSSAQLQREEDSLAKLIPASLKTNFAKEFPTAIDVKWTNFSDADMYMVEFNTGTSLEKNGYVPKHSHMIEYTKGGKNDGKWMRTIITYDTPEEMKANVDAKILANIEDALSKKGETPMDVESVKCAQKCIGKGNEVEGNVVETETEGYYVHGSKTYSHRTYVFNKLGVLYGM
jgi:hypothetical protein